jgi:uncharacterized protein
VGRNSQHMETPVRESLARAAREHLAGADAAHDFTHTLRVVRLARALAAAYAEAEADVVEAAAWLHDVGQGTGDSRGHAAVSAEVAAAVLPALGFKPAQVELVYAAIAEHSFSGGAVPASLEGRLLQDADRLDALGAVGIARTFASGRSRALYAAEDPFAAARALDDERYALDHFYRKLLRLPELLHTQEARALAATRVATMEGYLRALGEELGSNA